MKSLNMAFIHFATCANMRIVTSTNISASTAAGGAGAGLGGAGAGLGGAGAGLGGTGAGLGEAGAGLGEAGAGLGGAGAGLSGAGARLSEAGAGLGGAGAGLAGKNTSSSAYEIQIQMCFIHVLHFIAHVTVTKTTKHAYIYTKKLTIIRHGQVVFHGQVDNVVLNICVLQEKK